MVPRKVAVFAALSLLACKPATTDNHGAGPGTDVGSKLGEECLGNACAPGLFCLDSPQVCTRECTSDEQCGGEMTCQEWSDGQDVCAPPCTDDRSSPYEFVCIEGHQRRCENVPDHGNCTQCGCPDGFLCRPEGCVPKSQVGERCASDSDCVSENCSPYDYVCRVPVGTACNASNCDSCMTFADWSYCSRRCDSNKDCDGRGVCIGNSSSGYRCVVSCGWELNARTCPERCAQLPATSTSTGMYFCDCKTCTILEQKRKLGTACEQHHQCVGGLCLARAGLCELTSGSCKNRGGCSSRCTKSAECGAGAVCSEGVCFATCASDMDCQPTSSPFGSASALKCLMVPTEAGPSSVCDARGVSGATCREDSDCRFARCLSGVCRGAAATGGMCGADADCQAGRCCSGVCSAACTQP